MSPIILQFRSGIFKFETTKQRAVVIHSVPPFVDMENGSAATNADAPVVPSPASPPGAADVAAPQQRSPTEVAHAFLVAMARAWAAGDADSYAALFAPDGVLVHRSGAVIRGRTRILEGHAWAFKGTHRNSTLEDCRVISAALEGSGRISVTAVRTVVRGVVRNTYDVSMTLAPDATGAGGDVGAWFIAHFAAKPQICDAETAPPPPPPAAHWQAAASSFFRGLGVGVAAGAAAATLLVAGAAVAVLLLRRSLVGKAER